MNHITEQIKANKAEFDTQFGSLVLGILSNPPDRKSPVFINNELQIPRLKNHISSAQIKIIEAVKKELGEDVDYMTHMASKKAFDEGNIINQERRRIRTILNEAITEAKNI